MTLTEIKAALVDRTALALTAWAEARGDWRQGNSSVEERIATMVVARNRLKTPGRFMAKEGGYRGIVLARNQYSCWLDDGSPNNQALTVLALRILAGQPSGDPLFDETQFLADGVIAGQILDRTGGATYYYAPKAMVPAGRMPTEARKFQAAGGQFIAIGDQLFYRL